MPDAIARVAAASSPGEVLPEPVAATTIPSAPEATAASRSAPSVVDAGRDQVDAGTRRGGRHVPPWTAWPLHDHDAVDDPAQTATIRAAERVERRRVGLADVVGRLERAGQAHEHAHPAQVRARRGRDRVAQVGRPVEARLVRRPHGARHDDRRRGLQQEIPGERRLLDGVGALDDDDPVERRDRPPGPGPGRRSRAGRRT